MGTIIQKIPGLIAEQKFTTPPPRYSDASFAKMCEKEQLTRPATIKGVIETLKTRKYITQKKKSFHPTDLGIKVVDFLVAADMCFVDIKFTSRMEELLDEIQSQTKDKVDVLTEFWTRLKEDIEHGKEVKNKQQVSEYNCPKCGAHLLLKHSNFGPFYTCEKSKKPTKKELEEGKEPECDYIAKVGGNGEPVEKVKKVVEYADFKCKKCGAKMVKRESKYGIFFGCEKFPSCRTTADTEGKFKESKKKNWKK